MARTRWKVYGRKSQRRRERDDVSIDKQVHFATDDLAEHGVSPDQIDWFIEGRGNHSARWEHKRPEWLRLKADLLKPDTAGLWTFELDRTNRNVRATADLMEIIQKHGLSLISYKDGIDTTRNKNADDIVFITLKASLAQRESDKASERMSDAIAERMRELGPWGTPPFGATYTGEGKGMRQIVNPPHDTTMREMCRIYAAGASYGETAERMNALGLLNLSRDKTLVRWNRETVRSALHNILSLNGWRTPLKFNKDYKLTLPAGSGSYIERYAQAIGAERSDKYDPVVDDQLASAVVERRLGGQRGAVPTFYAMLTPILWMVGEGGGRKMYANKGHLYKTHGKPVKQIEVKQVDDVLLGHLAGLSFPDDVRNMIRRAVAGFSNSEDQEAAGREYQRLMRKAARLREMYADGTMESREEFDREMDKTKALLRSVEAHLGTAPEVDRIMTTLTTMAETLHIIPPVHRKRALQNLFERVEINEAGEITRLTLRNWARLAFGAIAQCGLQNALDRT